MQPKMELTSALGRTRRCGGEMLSGRIMMVVIVLPVMLRDSSPFIQYIRGQEDGWQRTCVCQSVLSSHGMWSSVMWTVFVWCCLASSSSLFSRVP
jgi:hypothetical protein